MSGCCPGPNADNAGPDRMRESVRAGYAQIAEAGALAVATGGCCGSTPGMTADQQDLAAQLGYDAEEIAALPQGANMGLSCGNPTALANLRPGQIVLDLGSGGGFDCFLAGPKVGAGGRVIGVDMTPEMLRRARSGVESYRSATGLDNVEFRLGEIEHLPLADNSVDVVISNCVINLSPDKAQVWREVGRVLKPGGTVAASDMALLQPLPEPVAEMMEALIGCVAGAVLLHEYRAAVEQAGLADVRLTPKPEYIASLRDFKDPLYNRIAAALPEGTAPADYVTSLNVQARKP